MQVEVVAEVGGERVEMGRGPAVLLGHAVRIGEDQILGDLAQRVVAGERRDGLFFSAAGSARSE